MKAPFTMVLISSLAFGLSVLGLHANPVEAQSKSIQGSVEFALPGEETFKPLTLTSELPSGTRIRTGSDGTATLLTLPDAAIRLQPDTDIVIRSLDYAKDGDQIIKRDALIEVNQGTLAALIQKNNPKVTNFRIQTPQGIAAARGTFYAVTVQNGKSFVGVKEGKVAVTPDKSAKPVASAN